MRVRGAGLIIRDGRLLVLVYHYPKGDVYAIPGGGLHEGETLAASVTREFQEELNLDIQLGALFCVADMMAQPKIPQTLHVVFRAEILAGEPKLNPAETSAASFTWLPLAQVGEVRLYPAINRQVLENPAAGLGYIGECQHREWA
ncbi:NUDIX domain-containing protein [Acanthopleuribacter pedis]|uniref:NUDIX domain-containing protein n=1 Tax=Acanthopleuribacter pedis TaxID=442870 RepID=A0A8J7Q1P1_9BACT|nr:NUDIX domain-containing protein [Acanthopleuribacter pedis]MBO1318802.1 NUDIX domain-containing protein [Acanthopleuribacter pedis]